MSMIDNASNIRTGDNPSYALADFFSYYPQFETTVPNKTITMYLNLAHASIKETRWRDSWEYAIGLFVAHFCTLYLQSQSSSVNGASSVLAAGQAKGLITSESVGDVSVSMDYSAIAQDLDGWATWKLTLFGQQLATMGKLVGRGGMYVY